MEEALGLGVTLHGEQSNESQGSQFQARRLSEVVEKNLKIIFSHQILLFHMRRI
jgi:hypothetical protein